MNKTLIKVFLLLAAVLTSTGGACYQVQETPEHRTNAAKYVLPRCTIAEKIDKGKCRFDVGCRFSTGYLMMDYKLEPPATFTFGDKPFDEKLALSIACEYKPAAFVLTDAGGGVRRDEHDFRKINFTETKINADRTSDLTIQLTDAAYPSETELRIVFESKDGKTQKLDVFRVPTEVLNKENLPEYDWKNLTLKIPALSWQEIDGNPTKIYLEVVTKLQKKHPGAAESSTALTYSYQSDVATFRLK